MKRGQGPVGIVLGLVVVIFLLGIIAWAFRPNTTGQVIAQDDVEKINFLSEPFELRAWVVDASGVQLDIKNSADEDYSVESIQVQSCGATAYGREIKAGDSRLFQITCALNQGEKFSGIVIVRYSLADGSEKEAFGNVRDIV